MKLKRNEIFPEIQIELLRTLKIHEKCTVNVKANMRNFGFNINDEILVYTFYCTWGARL